MSFPCLFLTLSFYFILGLSRQDTQYKFSFLAFDYKIKRNLNLCLISRFVLSYCKESGERSVQALTFLGSSKKSF